MKFQEEFRDPKSVQTYAHAIDKITTREWKIMEVCGGQTHSIVKYGIDELLPQKIELLHGPGCPVCVTPIEYINKAIEIAQISNVIFCSFGDMIKVPGTHQDLSTVKALGADVRIVYSPLDALDVAQKNPDREVVFFSVGFETTAPANAMAVFQARQRNLNNFYLLVSHVLVPPALEALLSSPFNSIQGFLAAGHVCAILGVNEYAPIVQKFKVPIVVTGFEPLDILQGIYLLIQQLEQGRFEVENQYERCVRPDGNTAAQSMIREVFQIHPRNWRGLGPIPESGLALRPLYQNYDAEIKFGPVLSASLENVDCHIGEVLRGQTKPDQCPSFGTRCTPENPLGATMVSSEGACAAYYRYRTGSRSL